MGELPAYSYSVLQCSIIARLTVFNSLVITRVGLCRCSVNTNPFPPVSAFAR
jgi:hypothetical protein